ncbi:MAG: hypothetical protein CHACPFDD_02405 [Phycisphaerae bacterium]|nr:hypothetical protein [Phycisphaerae bacterium]
MPWPRFLVATCLAALLAHASGLSVALHHHEADRHNCECRDPGESQPKKPHSHHHDESSCGVCAVLRADTTATVPSFELIEAGRFVPRTACLNLPHVVLNGHCSAIQPRAPPPAA